jgi:hypothetical protein
MVPVFSRIELVLVMLGWVSVSYGQAAHSTSSPEAPANLPVDAAAHYKPLQQAIEQSKAEHTFESKHLQDQLPKSCMQDLWQGLLPFVAKHSYVTAPDMERLTGVKMQEVADVAPDDSIANYENGTAHLSIRVEVLNMTSSYTWQVLQGLSNPRYGSTSIVDISCLDSSRGLQLSKLEADLFSLGFHKIGFTAQEVHAEYFWGHGGSVVAYFEVPVESVPTVTSLHIVGLSSGLAKPSPAH